MKSYVLKQDYRHWKKGETVKLRDGRAAQLKKEGVVDKPVSERKTSTRTRTVSDRD